MDEAVGVTDEDAFVLAALRRGDEQAFARLVDRHHASMVRVARAYTATNEAAEDIVRDAWIGVIKGLARFEARSALKTWIFRIVINEAMTKAGPETRHVPFASLGLDEPSVDPTLFNQSGRWSGWWVTGSAVTGVPDRVALANESRAAIDTIAALPPNQRLVILLRDVEGLSAEEACQLLSVSAANQRVLLHRARTRVRAALTGHVTERAGDGP